MDSLNHENLDRATPKRTRLASYFAASVLPIRFFVGSYLSEPAPQAPGNGRVALRAAFGGGRRFAPPAAGSGASRRLRWQAAPRTACAGDPFMN